ncbi:hypothetical protein OIU85_014248, partial [Salix viminalis]
MIVGLLETKVLKDNLCGVEKGINLPNWNFLSNENGGTTIRIVIGWDASVCSVQCLHYSSQWMTCDVRDVRKNSSLTVSFIYGLHTPADRLELWDYIARQGALQGQNAWVLMGDFNASLKASDSSGGAITWTGHHQDFSNCLYKAQLHSLPYKGLKYTWHNGQEQHSMIVKKLDWVLGNYALLREWPNAQAEFLARTVSDHSSMVLRLLPCNPSFPPQFKFLNLWTNQEEFLSIVTNAWQSRVD